MVLRRKVPPNADLETALTTAGPMRALPVQFHKPSGCGVKQHSVMTEASCFSSVKNVKLDYSDITKLPPTYNVKELKEWEVAEEQAAAERRAAAAQTSPSPVMESTASSSLAVVGLNEREDPRTYSELLDLYSMHEFVIRKGKALRNTPEFASFKRHYIASWGDIEEVIEALEAFLESYGIDLAYIDGKQLAELASFQSVDIATRAQLLRCIANAEDVLPLIEDSTRPYHFSSRGHHLAAMKIQSVWRMYHQRIAYIHLLIGTRAAIVIQRQWGIHRSHYITQCTLRSIQETRLAQWRRTMSDFVSRWPQIRDSRRIVVHIPSLSYPTYQAKKTPFYFARQLGQLTRISALADPAVEMVFVVPFKPEAEVVKYCFNLLEDAGLPNVSGRLTLLVPENAERMPDNISLSRLVLLSPRLIKTLSAICAGRTAYIIPGVIGAEELTLAAQLNVPLLAPEPRIALAYGTKSGCRRLLEAGDVLTLPGATQLRTRSDLLQALATLILDNRRIQRWLVKLDNESESKGYAYLDVSRLRSLKESDADQSSGTGSLLHAIIVRELDAHGGRRMRLLHTSSYPDWARYLDMVDSVGACIEAVPPTTAYPITANLFIEPSGTVHVNSVVEPLVAPAFTVLGSCFPHTAPVPYSAIRDASLSVGKAAFRKRIIGYVSIDYVVSEGDAGWDARSTGDTVRVWGVDVDLQLTTNAAAHDLAVVLSKSTWNAVSGECVRSETGKPLAYVYSGVIYNPYISAINHAQFFTLCRSHGMAFDCERRCGLVFHMVDVLLRGCLGVLSIDDNASRVVRRLTEFQSIINMELPKQGEHAAQSNYVYFSSIVRQLARLL